MSKALQVFWRNDRGTWIGDDQLLDCSFSIAGDPGENFFRDGEDAAAWLVREAVIKNTGLSWPRRVTLHDHRRIDLLQVIERSSHRTNDFHARTPLANVGFQDEWQHNSVFAQRVMKRKQPVGRGLAGHEI